jgi:hypothetical protein
MVPLPAPWRAARIALLCTLSLSVLGSCKDTSGPTTNPLPVLTAVSPSMLVAGADGATLTLTGSGFVRHSQARWNGADRVTHFQHPETLTVDLEASDLATITTNKLTVVNGAPGGGTSGETTVIVGYPAPTISSISPTSSPLQSVTTPGHLTITITGTGFVNNSLIRVGPTFVPPVSITPTQIVAQAPNSLFSTPGMMDVTIRNSVPGGGESNAVSFAVPYPVPSIAALAPDSVLTGPSFTLTVTGTGFGPGSVIRWNGAARPTTFVSSTRVTAVIPASDVVSETIAAVSVFSPTPGGGTSNAMSYRVKEPAPLITGVTPGTITAGSGPVTVTLSGTNFRPNATAQWDGQDRTASVTSTTSLNVTLTDTDLAIPRVGRLTVTNPGPSGMSNAVAVAVISGAESLSIARTIGLTHVDLVYDSGRGVIYASVPSSATQHANEIVRIDPTSGAITGSLSVGSNPGPLEITDNGQYLYVGLRGAPKIVRVALATFTKDIDMDVPGHGFFGSVYAEDIVAIPGAPQTIAASTYYTGVSPRNAGTRLFVNGTLQPLMGPDHTGSNRVTRGPSGARIYGYNNETTEFGFRSLVVTANGLVQDTVISGLIDGFGVDIEYGGGFIYATTGEVVNVYTLKRVGTIPTGGIVEPDVDNARVHLLNGQTLWTFHYTTLNSFGSFTDASLAGHTKLIRWGSNGLAAGGGNTIVLLEGGLVAP